MSAPVESPAQTVHDEGLAHVVCCDEDRALCGADVSNAPWNVPDDPDCLVCAELEGLPCEWCGQ